jgi:nitrous oxidase accessory protein
MGEQRTALIPLLILFSLLFSVPEIGIVKAEPQLIVVPDHYASVQEAVDSAFDGDVVLVKCGTYNGSVVINKSISLIGEDKEKTIILGDWSLNGTVVLVQYDDVVVKNFTLKAIQNSGPNGRGVHLLHVKHCQVADCNFASGIGVWLYGASDNTVEKNQIDGTHVSMPPTAGIKLQYSQGNRIIRNNVMEFTYGIGISLDFSSRNYLVENQLSNNYYGVLVKDSNSNSITDNEVTVSMSVFVTPTEQVMRGSYGIRLQFSSNNSVAGNTFVDCPKGVRIVSSSCYNLVEGNTVSGSRYVGLELAEDANYNQIIANNIRDNGVGASFANASSNIVYHNSFIDNSVLITSLLTDEINFFDNGSEGNYWSNYNGTDSNGDGIGETPYIIDENNQDNYPFVDPAIIPEFPSWIIPPLFLMATLSAILFKKRLFHQRS